MLLLPHGAARVAEGAWIGPDVQHFADQLLRTLQLPGRCLTFLVQSDGLQRVPRALY